MDQASTDSICKYQKVPALFKKLIYVIVLHIFTNSQFLTLSNIDSHLAFNILHLIYLLLYISLCYSVFLKKFFRQKIQRAEEFNPLMLKCKYSVSDMSREKLLPILKN